MVDLAVGSVVFDAWWPWRVGSVVRVTKSTTHVRWSDGGKWIYDRAHRQFLRTMNARKTHRSRG